MIGILRGGYENVNLAYAKEKNILVFNTPGRNADAVSDFTIGMMIAEARNIAMGHHGLKNGQMYLIPYRPMDKADYGRPLDGKSLFRILSL